MNATSSTNYYSKQQALRNASDKIPHSVLFFSLGLFFTLCISFLLSIPMQNHHNHEIKIRIKSNNHAHNKQYLKHNRNTRGPKRSIKPKKHKRHKNVVHYINLPLLSTNNKPKLRNINHDYDGIYYKPLINFSIGRTIQESKVFQGRQVFVVHNEDDDEYSIDQIEVMEERIKKTSAKDDKGDCKAISWYQSKYPNCNILHELSFINKTVLLDHGYYRDVLKYTDKTSSKYGLSIKTLRNEHSYDHEALEMIRIDALVMEKLTYSKYIANIHGYCGTSIVQELFMDDVEELFVPRELSTDINGNKIATYVTNKFTPLQMLYIALDLAYPLHDLHYYHNGSAIIVHDDIQLGQYLFSFENEFKLNDFNRAEVMFFNEKKQNYCTFSNGKVYGKVRFCYDQFILITKIMH